jgi:hypothetical protein
MTRRIAAMLLLGGLFLMDRAAASPYADGAETAIPAPEVTAPEPAAGADSVSRRPSFFRRVIDYFDKSTVDRTFEKKIDFTFAGGPSYSKSTSLGIGVLAAGLYRVDRTDSVTQPSDISIFASISISGFYSVGIEGNTFFSRGRSKFDYKAAFSSAPRDLWGIGYTAGRHNRPVSYVEKQYEIHARYLYQLFPKTYVGTRMSFESTKGKNFDATGESYIDYQAHSYTATGIGAIVEYDSRDIVSNAFRGIYVSLQGTVFPRGLSNCGRTLYRASFTFDWYQRVWRGCTLACDLYGEWNSSRMPWPMLARMGGSQRMRGYYEGRYADNNLIAAQLELRQRIWRRIGCTVWCGAGNVFSERPGDRFRWSHTLPNYGVGLRWELKKRVNVRLDYGFGRRTSGFLLNINEAF